LFDLLGKNITNPSQKRGSELIRCQVGKGYTNSEKVPRKTVSNNY